MFEFDIEDTATPLFEDLILAENNMSDPLKRAADEAIKSVHENFEAGGRPAWQPHKKEVPWPLLMDTMSLYDSIDAEIHDKEVWVLSTEEYAPYQDLGTEHIPARPFLVIQNSDADEIEKIIAQHFDL